MLAPTFDESWHRVSQRRIRLRPSVEIFAQQFRGQRWYIIRDTMSGKFFRIRPAAYEFICEIERSETVGEAWGKRLALDPEKVPGQGEIVRLLSQLHRAGLIRSDVEGDVEPLAAAFAKEKFQEEVQRWSSVLFFKLPLWNPDAFLRTTLPAVGWLISWPGFVAWLLLLLWGAEEVLNHWTEFSADGAGFLGVANLMSMYGVMVVIKLLHEFGHGYTCRKLGGEVPEMGAMLLLFNPLPYVDASSSTAFRNKWHRILVGSGGMLVELALAAVAAIIWAYSGKGTVHVLAYNAVVAASVVTILFNANPLLRYDGYHMLSDWLELPNLQARSGQMMQYLLERWFFGLKNGSNPAESKREAWWLGIYYVASFCYRMVMMVGILLVVSLHYLVLGVILALVFGFIWGLMPMFKAVMYLLKSPRLESCRPRALATVSIMVIGVLAFLCLVPLPNHFRADGVVRAEPFSRVYTGTDGLLQNVLVSSGVMVRKGTPLIQMVNEELTHELDELNGELERAQVQARLALDEDPVAYASMKTYFQALEVRRKKIIDEHDALLLKAPADGRWLAPDVLQRRGSMMPKGLELGVIQGEERFYISAVVKQDDVSRLFTSQQVKETEVRVRGQEGEELKVNDFSAIPSEREFLPSAALGILGGGTSGVETRQSIEDRKLPGSGIVESETAKGTKATEPVFELRAFLKEDPKVNLLHGQRAVARMTLASEPLMWQWVRELRQLFQHTYHL
jgi:putative peptide zinc metalloprotease protein